MADIECINMTSQDSRNGPIGTRRPIVDETPMTTINMTSQDSTNVPIDMIHFPTSGTSQATFIAQDCRSNTNNTNTSGNTWEHCTKNPDHTSFIPISEFSVDNLPVDCRNQDNFEKIKCAAELTVRLRINHTSTSRPNYADLPERFHRRTGTGIVRNVQRCSREEISSDPLLESVSVGDIDNYKKWWIDVATSAHGICDTEEVQGTKVDFFCDGMESRTDGTMKSIWGVKMLKCDVKDDWCLMRCVTEDEGLAVRLEQYLRQWKSHLDKHESTFVSSFAFFVLALFAMFLQFKRKSISQLKHHEFFVLFVLCINYMYLGYILLKTVVTSIKDQIKLSFVRDKWSLMKLNLGIFTLLIASSSFFKNVCSIFLIIAFGRYIYYILPYLNRRFMRDANLVLASFLGYAFVDPAFQNMKLSVASYVYFACLSLIVLVLMVPKSLGENIEHKITLSFSFLLIIIPLVESINLFFSVYIGPTFFTHLYGWTYFLVYTEPAEALYVAIVSHPHGMPKHVTLGKARVHVSMTPRKLFDLGNCLEYEAATCQGSSGSLVVQISKGSIYKNKTILHRKRGGKHRNVSSYPISKSRLFMYVRRLLKRTTD